MAFDRQGKRIVRDQFSYTALTNFNIQFNEGGGTIEYREDDKPAVLALLASLVDAVTTGPVPDPIIPPDPPGALA